MARPPQLTSSTYPFLPVRFTIRGRRSGEVLALLDTGFTGDLGIPTTILSDNFGLPDSRVVWQLADGTVIDAPVYLGAVEIVGLGSVPAAITILGTDYILGRGVLDRFKVTLDHGERVVIEL